jgi:hypothetical protein
LVLHRADGAVTGPGGKDPCNQRRGCCALRRRARSTAAKNSGTKCFRCGFWGIHFRRRAAPGHLWPGFTEQLILLHYSWPGPPGSVDNDLPEPSGWQAPGGIAGSRGGPTRSSFTVSQETGLCAGGLPRRRRRYKGDDAGTGGTAVPGDNLTLADDIIRFCHLWGATQALRNPSALSRVTRYIAAANIHVLLTRPPG